MSIRLFILILENNSFVKIKAHIICCYNIMASEICEDSEATFYFYNLIYMQVSIAQWIEQQPSKLWVVSSSLTGDTIEFKIRFVLF